MQLLFLLGLVSNTLAAGIVRFGTTCTDVDMVEFEYSQEVYVAATCDTPTWSWSSWGWTEPRTLRSLVPLNSCLANTDGVLSCQSHGNAFQSCRNCTLPAGSTLLTCSCARLDGSTHAASVDLDNCVANDGGFMVCLQPEYGYGRVTVGAGPGGIGGNLGFGRL